MIEAREPLPFEDEPDIVKAIGFQRALRKTIEQDASDALYGITRARIEGDTVRCGACGSRLYDIHQKFIDLTGVSEEIKYQLKSIPVNILLGIVKQPVEIKCKHRSAGVRCGAINTIQL